MPHDYTKPHVHAPHQVLVAEDEAGDLEGQILIDALQDVLIRKNLLTASEVTREIARLEAPGLHLGTRLVLRAWRDPDYRRRLLENGKAAAAEEDVIVGEAQLLVVENTPKIHNLITCTLCSCYPRSILGQPPSWYISKAYRARAVREPRVVLAEFGLDLGPTIRLDVHDSNADMRYLVLPEFPVGGDTISDADLSTRLSRDHLIGVARDV